MSADKFMIAGEAASERLMRMVQIRAREQGVVDLPTKKQVALVASALADHTAIMHMVQFDRMSRWHRDQEEQLWPTETSIGRWFHAVADDLSGIFE